MSNQNVRLGDAAKPVIEPAPEVGVVVRFNGQQKVGILKIGESSTFQFGTFPVEVELVEIYRKKQVPTTGPPYHWRIVTTCGYERTIRAMDEDNALRIFRADEGDEWQIKEISAVVH